MEYHKIIKKPIALDVIRNKLKPENENHYTDLKQVMADIRLMFKNAYTFNSVRIKELNNNFIAIKKFMNMFLACRWIHKFIKKLEV